MSNCPNIFCSKLVYSYREYVVYYALFSDILLSTLELPFIGKTKFRIVSIQR